MTIIALQHLYTYRKPTHTDQYLNWNSNHPAQQKLGIVRNLMHRAETLTSQEQDLISEKDKVRDALRTCGYPEWALKEGEQLGQKKVRNNSDAGSSKPKPKGFVVLPYMKGVTERLKRTYGKHDIKLFSKPGYTLRNALVRPKDLLRMEEKCRTVYKLECDICHKIYIDESERSFGERMDEHHKSIEFNI